MRSGQARIVQVDTETVCTWRDRAAQHGRLVMRYVWPQLPLRACQLDELWRVVHTQNAPLAWANTYRDTSGGAWVWLAFAPEWRLVVAVVVGTRTPAAPIVLERVAPVTTDLVPFLPAITCRNTAPPCGLCMANGTSRHGVARGARPPSTACSPPRAARCPSRDDARAGSRGGGRPSRRVWRRPTHGRALGPLPTSATITTSVVAREHLARRQHNRRLTRKPCVQPERPWLEKQLWLALAYTPVVLAP